MHIDARLTARALAHVLENAAHYSPPGSTIGVDLHLTDGGLRIAVQDQGPGIDPADLPHLFDRFYRGATAPKHASGSGMGLAIARGLLAAEEGRIFAENLAGGARFSMLIPAEHRPI